MTETTLQERLRATTQEMASACSVPMDLWNRHSNAVLEAADALTDAQAEVERLRKALEKICEPITVAADAETVVACQDLHDLICDIAQTALGRTP